jgi:hypothetical protein
MRSSKSRSRSKSNRNNNNRSVGNIVNRVFDSSGPEGKVRGTPQQIIDKYNQLARDAQLSNDRVATENFQQHAEHYQRMLSEALREQEARREEQERQNRERQAERDRERAARQEREAAEAGKKAADKQDADTPVDTSADVIDVPGEEGGSGLVETPESKSEQPEEKPKGRTRSATPRKPRAKKAPAKAKKTDDDAEAPTEAASPEQPSTEEAAQ